MKLGLILSKNIWFTPYVKIYTAILDKYKIDYELVSWNKDGTEENCGIQYQARLSDQSNNIKKFFCYYKYKKFLVKIIKERKYDKLIVFDAQLGVFLSNFLDKYYKKKYILDYRDLSIEQNSIFKNSFYRAVENSYSTMISSPGFKKCLPENFDYILSHNFNIEHVKNALLEPFTSIKNSPYIVLTIGSIRDYSSNIEVVNALANKQNFHLSFVGKGYAADLIKSHAITENINNISFEGYYPKEKEKEYISNSSFLNIYYPKVITHSTAISNRFYNALIFKRPMIVTKNSTQGDFCDKYNLGISIEDCNNLEANINDFIKDLDYNEFCLRCNNLLKEFLNDYNVFEKKICDFVS